MGKYFLLLENSSETGHWPLKAKLRVVELAILFHQSLCRTPLLTLSIKQQQTIGAGYKYSLTKSTPRAFLSQDISTPTRIIILPSNANLKIVISQARTTPSSKEIFKKIELYFQTWYSAVFFFIYANKFQDFLMLQDGAIR